MRTEALLRMTSCEAFIKAINHEIHLFKQQYTDEKNIPERDKQAIKTIEEHLTRGISSGVILRQDLKIILRAHYGYARRFWFSLARRFEALRKKPEFSLEALQRGDARPPDDGIRMQLEKQKMENQLLTEQLKKKTAQLVDAWGRIDEFQEKYSLLCTLVQRSGVTLPEHLLLEAQPITIPSRTLSEYPASDRSKLSSHFGNPLSPALFGIPASSDLSHSKTSLPSSLPVSISVRSDSDTDQSLTR